MFINNFEPVAIQIFSLEIRWYSLAYIFGILFAWMYCKKILINDKNISKLFDDLISYLIIGIILGGRLGYVLFYNTKYYLILCEFNYDSKTSKEVVINNKINDQILKIKENFISEQKITYNFKLYE